MAPAAQYLIPPDSYRAPGFLLRGYQPGDGEHLCEAVSSSYEHLKRFLHWPTPERNVGSCERRCREARARWLQAADFTIGIWAPDEARLLGGTGYHLREGGLDSGNAQIGMWIRSDSAGRGLGTAVLRALLRWGFNEWPWLRLTWRCSSYNLPSQRAAEKAGLQREGVLRSDSVDPDGRRRDTHCYAALRDEWLAGAGAGS